MNLRNVVYGVIIAILLSANFAVFAEKNVDEVVFCVTGDSRGDFSQTKINKPVLEKLAVALKKESPAFVLFTGDLVCGYSRKLEKQLTQWRDIFMKPLIESGIKVYPSRGNHDASEGKLVLYSRKRALKVWRKVFSGEYALPSNGPKMEKGISYFVKEKNVLVFVLDNYAKDRKHRINLHWMRQVLKANQKEDGIPNHLFAVCHEPAFAVKHTDCLAVFPNERDEFVKLFLNYGGVCFFCGHDHFYNHAKIAYPEGEFHQFICGTGGAPLRPWNKKYADKRVVAVHNAKNYGYMLVHVKGNHVALTMKGWDKDGKLLDLETFSYNFAKIAK